MTKHPDISPDTPEATKATAAPADAPAKRGRGRPRKHPVATPAASQPETVQPVAAEATQQPERVEQAAPAAQDAPVAAVAPESAIDRRWRLRREIEAAEREASGIRADLTALAVECEAGNPKALARRAALREQLAAVADRIGDKQAALAATLPLAEAQIAQERHDRRERAFAEAAEFFRYMDGWASHVDSALVNLGQTIERLFQAEAAALSCTQPHVPISQQWLIEQDRRAFEDTLVARLCRLGVLHEDHMPGPLHTGNLTIRDAVVAHTRSARQRLATVGENDAAPVEAPSPPWARSDGEPWRHRAARVDPLTDRLSVSAGHAD